MSHNNTPALVDLRNPENLPAVAYSLHKAIKANPGMTRQQLSAEIAKALGARSLEAYQAMSAPAPVTDAPRSEMDMLLDAINAQNTPPQNDYQAKLADMSRHWYVVRQPNTRHYLTGDWSDKDAPLTLKSIFSAAARKLVFLPLETARYVCDFPEKFVRGDVGTLSYVPLEEAEPALFQAIHMNTEEMHQHLTKNGIRSLGFLSLGYEDAKRQFTLGGDRFSLLDYAAFLVNELRHFVDTASLAFPVHSDSEIEAHYDTLTRLRNDFDKAFYEHLHNNPHDKGLTGNLSTDVENGIINILSTVVEADKISRKLSTCRLRFPDGLPALPQAVHLSNDHAGAVEQFDKLREVVIASVNFMRIR
tara:strand:+ start:6081 stop:7163 length:1083 start_codon:yes stop_codon:yes gene_type:complete